MEIITPKRLYGLLSLCCGAPRLIAVFVGVVALTLEKDLRIVLLIATEHDPVTTPVPVALFARFPEMTH
jgi:hypothetical protein